ncbi:MAG: peptidoglycan DD-metalloendopeptidase family protein [Solirubrobacterales bacterium]|nr:peptidoglycan DD-metalloendopeptidase family protein [Solirubrobacterales bacterium]MBV9916138.1 peptidoglycan DD-metalloendopeptidase family protein [Solirubrobacterales bacterium]
MPWQVLAAINEIETDYGRNLSVSSAGAVGWMQFLPSTWKTWGMDANGDKVADPYNPVDAIFSAARYLHAAGASSNLSNAIFAYNHASWYVQSVLLRAKLVGGMPDGLISALSGLVEGHFPVAARSKYADDAVTALAARPVKTPNAAVPVASDPTSKAVSIFAKQGSPAIAVNDGKIVKVGENQSWGKYIQLQDQTGNIYTYAQLGQIPSQYPVPKPVKISAAQLTRELSTPALPAPKQPATAGQQRSTPATVAAADKAAKPQREPARPAPSGSVASAQQSQAPLVKERLFAYPARPNSYAAGGAVQVRAREAAQIANFQNYFSDVLHLDKNQYTLKPLKPGAVVVAGTILGRLGAGTKKTGSHLQFMIEPAGKKAPQIDPKPILDGWKLLQATAVYRANGVNPFFGAGAKNPSIGQILLMSKEQLQNRILQDPHVQIYSCGRRDIEAGLVDRRVLATLEFLSASGLDPTVSGLICGRGVLASSDAASTAGAGGSSVDISRINNIPVSGHQGRGGIADTTIRRLLTLQGAMKPDQIISTMSYKGQTNTLALPDHSDRIQVTFTPLFGSNKRLSSELGTLLQPGQWTQLINRIGQIQEPVVPIAPSKYAVRVASSSTN